MASKTQQFIYALRAKYEGKGEVAALSSDLKAMGDIKTFQKLQTDFTGTTAALIDTKAKTRDLRKLMNAPGGEAFKESYQQAADKVKKLSKNLLEQKSALVTGSQSMAKQGVAMGDLAGEYEKLDAKTKSHGNKIAALKTLGVQSFASIEQKIKSLHGAYKILEKDPSISARELRAAKVKMEADITSITGKVSAHGQKVAAFKTLGVKSYAAIEQKVKSLHEAYKILAKDPSISAKELRAAKVKMEADITSLTGKVSAHGQKVAAFKTLGVKSYAAIEQKVKSLHAAYKILEKDPSISAKELRAAKVKMEADIASLTGKTGKLVNKFDHLKAGIAGVAGLTAGGYVFGNMIQQAGTAARELENAARVAGTSVEEFSALSYAVESVGISGEKLADMSKDVKDKIGDFVENGGGEFKDFFENVAPLVGITAEELIKMSGPDCLVAIKKAMDDANISAESQVFYLEAIANDASLLTPLLQDNGKALKEKADRARELGIAISDMDNAKLVEMATVTKDLGKTMNVLTMEIVSAAAPAVQVLMGYAQKAVAWFNQLSPGMQKFIVYAGAGATVVTALGVALAPLLSSIALGIPLVGSITAGIGGMTSFMGLGAIASKALGIAMRGIPFVGIALLVYQVGSALGWWEPIMNTVQKGAISLAAGIHLLGLKIRWLWNVLTGDDAEAAAIEKRMAEVDKMYGEMFANIGKKQDDHLEATKENQDKLTSEVRKGAGERLAIEREAQKKIAALSTEKESSANGKKAEKPDEFGLLPSERKSIDDEVAKLDATGRRRGRLEYKYFEEDQSTQKRTPLSANKHSALMSQVDDRITSLPELKPAESRSSSSAEKQASRTVEVKFLSASLHGDEDSTEKVIADLQRMGAMV